jgi:hypothetical protein
MPKDNNSIKANELSNFQIKKFIVTVTAFWSAKNTAKIAIIKATIKNSCTTAFPFYRVAIKKPPRALRLIGAAFPHFPQIQVDGLTVNQKRICIWNLSIYSLTVVKLMDRMLLVELPASSPMIADNCTKYIVLACKIPFGNSKDVCSDDKAILRIGTSKDVSTGETEVLKEVLSSSLKIDRFRLSIPLKGSQLILGVSPISLAPFSG